MERAKSWGRNKQKLDRGEKLRSKTIRKLPRPQAKMVLHFFLYHGHCLAARENPAYAGRQVVRNLVFEGRPRTPGLPAPPPEARKHPLAPGSPIDGWPQLMASENFTQKTSPVCSNKVLHCVSLKGANHEKPSAHTHTQRHTRTRARAHHPQLGSTAVLIRLQD